MVLLNDNWRFHLGDEENSYEKFHKDEDWRKVTIPHDWSVEYPKREEYSSGTGYVIGGTAWYRKTFRIEGEKEEHFYASMEFTRTARSGSTAIILEKDRTVMCLSVTM